MQDGTAAVLWLSEPRRLLWLQASYQASQMCLLQLPCEWDCGDQLPPLEPHEVDSAMQVTAVWSDLLLQQALPHSRQSVGCTPQDVQLSLGKGVQCFSTGCPLKPTCTWLGMLLQGRADWHVVRMLKCLCSRPGLPEVVPSQTSDPCAQLCWRDSCNSQCVA